MPRSEIAVIVESFNESEHSSVDRLAQALESAQQAAQSYGDARVLLADGGDNPEVLSLLESRFPAVERISPGVPDYDMAKNAAAAAADARIVAYLDGDCLPRDSGWLAALVDPIVNGDAIATAGSTTYEGGWLQRVLTVMDFGFLLPQSVRPVECYASNNSAFDGQALIETPAPDADMRCRCYAHAQLFQRKGTPIQMAPRARVQHEAVPLLDERLRRGWDLVTAARVNPHLPEARVLRLGVLAAPLFVLDALRLDFRRVLRWGGQVGLGPVGRVLALPVMTGLRAIDFVGVVAALRGKPAPGGG